MKIDESNKQDDTRDSSAVRDCPDSAGSQCTDTECLNGTIYVKLGTKLVHMGKCPKCHKPTHVATVEVSFTVEVDVKAESEDDAMQKAQKEVQARYDKELKSSMAGSPKRVEVEAVWADEYEDPENDK